MTNETIKSNKDILIEKINNKKEFTYIITYEYDVYNADEYVFPKSLDHLSESDRNMEMNMSYDDRPFKPDAKKIKHTIKDMVTFNEYDLTRSATIHLMIDGCFKKNETMPQFHNSYRHRHSIHHSHSNVTLKEINIKANKVINICRINNQSNHIDMMEVIIKNGEIDLILANNK